MSRVGIGASGGAWPIDPSVGDPVLFHAAGRLGRPDRHEIRLLAATTSTPTRCESQKRAAKAWDEGRFKKSVVPVKDVNGLTILDQDEHMRPAHRHAVARRRSSPRSCRWARWAASMRSAIQAHPEVEDVNHVHHAGNSSGIVDGAAAVLIGSKEAGKAAGLKPRARIRAFANHRLRSGADADRAGRRHRKAVLETRRHEALRHRPVRAERGLRRRGAALHAGLRSRPRRRSTSTAARSPWAIRSARPAP